MIIPIGHERTTVRRLPWVTISIVVLCSVLFLATRPSESKNQRVGNEYLKQAMGYFVEHPYLDLPPRFFDLLALRVEAGRLTSEIELMRTTGPLPPASDLARQQEQTHLDQLVGGFFEALDSSPSRVLGLVPANLHLYALITYQFMHGGWMHLIFNMIFLFVIGPFIEDVWGRPLYAGFYLTAGVVSAIMFAVRYPELETALIGASGAVAGAMGAFFVRFIKVKMRFILWVGVPLGPFQAPAWVILPFWFLLQLLLAQVFDLALPGSGGGGVAFWVHVWGFAFGAAVAATISHFRIEDRYIHPAIESKVVLVENAIVEEAALLAETGEDDAAIAVLEQELAARPQNVDAAMALWNLSFDRRGGDGAIPYMVKALEHAVRVADNSFVIAALEKILYSGCLHSLEPNLGVRIADILVDDSRHEAARDTIALASRSVNTSTPVAVLRRLAQFGISLDVPGADSIVAATLAHPELPPAVREELESATAGGAETPPDAPPDGQPERRAWEREPESGTSVYTVEAVAAIPRRIAGDCLEIEVEGKPRKLALSAVKALAVCGISRAGQKPVVLVDLLLDAPGGNRPDLRVFRMTSESFDPRHLVGGDDAPKAFQRLLARILELSHAVPLPGPDAACGKKFRSFPSIGAYQREVLGASSPA